MRFKAEKDIDSNVEFFSQTKAEMNPRAIFRAPLSSRDARLTCMASGMGMIACGDSSGLVVQCLLDVQVLHLPLVFLSYAVAKDGKPVLEHVGSFRTFFGTALCVCFSEDGKIVAAGGQDDMISVFCCVRKRLLARLEGHLSFVNGVSIHRKGEGYEIVSVGDDANALLFEITAEDCARKEGVDFDSLNAKKTDVPTFVSSDAASLRGVTLSPLTDVIYTQNPNLLVLVENSGAVRIFKELQP